MQAIGGLAEASAGGMAGGWGGAIGWPVMAHGLDQFFTGVNKIVMGSHQNTITEQALQKAGMSPNSASFTNDVLSMGSTMGGIATINRSRLTSFSNYRSLDFLSNFEKIQVYKTKTPPNTIVNLERLKKQFASLQQVGENGKIIAGKGSTEFRNVAEVVKKYGGLSTDWVKKSSSSYSYRIGSGNKFETHWIENLHTHKRVEFKTKIME